MSKIVWTKDEFKFLKNNYMSMNDEEFAVKLGNKTKQQIKEKRQREGLVIDTSYSKEFLINEFWRFYKEYGRYPLGKDLRNTVGYPHNANYTKYWGSWNRFLLDIGILGDYGWYKHDEQVLKDLYSNGNKKEIIDKLIVKRSWSTIIKKANLMGLHIFNSNNTYHNKDYDGIKNDYLNGMSLIDIAKKYNYNADSAICGVLKKLNIIKRNNRWTKQQIQILKDKYSYEEWDIIVELLKPFTKEDIIHKAYKLGLKREIYFWSDEELKIIKDNYNKMSLNNLVKLLPNRTYDSIITKAYKLGLSYKEYWGKEDVDNFIDLYPITDNNELVEIFNRTKSAILSMAYVLNLTKNDLYKEMCHEKQKKFLLNKLKLFADELGTTPTSSQIRDNENMPGILSYYRYFDSYNKVCESIGLVPNLNLFGEPISPLYSKNNDICFSKGELHITNFFIDNNTRYQKEGFYKDYINDDRCGNKRCDWIINGNIFVELFGMPEKEYYKIRMENKIKICKDNNIQLIEIYPKDLSYNLKGVKEKLSIINN
jgi:hypothetical protein